jgi:hypothetical protein
MGVFARGKRALSISDRSGLRFPYTEMVREWNGSLVHYSEYEPKQPQLEPKPVGSDPQALQNPRPQVESTAQLILLDNNPFEIIINSVDGNTYVNVYSLDHQAYNLQSYNVIPDISGVTDIDSANGFTIQLGKIDKYGIVTGNTTNDVLTNPISYFYFQSADNATLHGVKGGGSGCSAGPVTLEAL